VPISRNVKFIEYKFGLPEVGEFVDIPNEPDVLPEVEEDYVEGFIGPVEDKHELHPPQDGQVFWHAESESYGEDSDNSGDYEGDEQGGSSSDSGESLQGSADEEFRRIKNRLRRNPLPPVFYSPEFANVVSVPVPNSYTDASRSAEKRDWEQAMQEELNSLTKKDTHCYVQKPAGAMVLPVKWVFAVKTDEDGQIKGYKAQLFAKGFHQTVLTLGNVYAPICTHTTRRSLFSLAARDKMHMHHVDLRLHCLIVW
jgi:hypothetical protein